MGWGAGPKLPNTRALARLPSKDSPPKKWDLEVLSQESCFPAKLALGSSISTQKMKSPLPQVTGQVAEWPWGPGWFTESRSWSLPGGKSGRFLQLPHLQRYLPAGRPPDWVERRGAGAEKGEKEAACSWWVPSQSRGWMVDCLPVFIISKGEGRGCGSWLLPLSNSPSQEMVPQ